MWFGMFGVPCLCAAVRHEPNDVFSCSWYSCGQVFEEKLPAENLFPLQVPIITFKKWTSFILSVMELSYITSVLVVQCTLPLSILRFSDLLLFCMLTIVWQPDSNRFKVTFILLSMWSYLLEFLQFYLY